MDYGQGQVRRQEELDAATLRVCIVRPSQPTESIYRRGIPHLRRCRNAQPSDQRRAHNCSQTGFEEMSGDLLEEDFWPAMTSGLPVISELSSGCFQVKSAPQFSRSGYHDLDAQKIQALAVKKPCQRSASLLLCDRKL
jgi:hypothetical protein